MRISPLITAGKAALAASVVLIAASASAQQLYRIVGPDGKVTYSDRAPTNQQADSLRGSGGALLQPAGGAVLPLELREIAAKFPVTLYTGSDCNGCDGLRLHLMQRGIPFTERTVTSPQDIDALRKISGGNELPFGTIGGQQLSGFTQQEWTEYLDLAGYPKQSRLPPNYRQPAATPLVAVAAKTEDKKAEASSATSQASAPATTRARQEPAPNGTKSLQNPAGIRF